MVLTGTSQAIPANYTQPGPVRIRSVAFPIMTHYYQFLGCLERMRSFGTMEFFLRWGCYTSYCLLSVNHKCNELAKRIVVCMRNVIVDRSHSFKVHAV
jgi:hypothetical protein